MYTIFFLKGFDQPSHKKLITNSFFKNSDPTDVNLGLKWCLAVASEGDSEAMLLLSRAYDLGKGTEKNHGKAMEWLKKSIEAENTKAIIYMGEKYEKGLGVKQDYMEALEYFMQAGQKGSEAAIQNFHRTLKEALEKCLPAAQNNELEAMYNVGRLYLYQLDYESSIKWLSKADERELAKASALLGVFYQNGQGVNKDYSKAVEYLEKAVKSNLEGREAIYEMLSELYASGGYGLPKNEGKAKKYKTLMKQ